MEFYQAGGPSGGTPLGRAEGPRRAASRSAMECAILPAMASAAWSLENSDRELFARELESFVPPRIYDAHAHLYRRSFFRGVPPEAVAKGPDADYQTYLECASALTPGRQRAYLLYFSAAKQSTTRASRVEKYMQQILKGKGMDDD